MVIDMVVLHLKLGVEQGGGLFVVNTCGCHVRVCRSGPCGHFVSLRLGVDECTVIVYLCMVVGRVAW